MNNVSEIKNFASCTVQFLTEVFHINKIRKFKIEIIYWQIELKCVSKYVPNFFFLINWYSISAISS